MTTHDTDPLRTLKPRHWQALEVLVDGGTQEAAAEAAGVSRETVNRWANSLPAFIAGLNRARRQRRETLHDRTTSLVAVTMDTVEEAIKDGDARLALAVLQMDARHHTPPPTGPESADEVIHARVDERARRVDLQIHEMREATLRKTSGRLSPDRFAIEVRVENEMLAELGEPLHPEHVADDGPHWSEGEVIPCSRIIAALTPSEALTPARPGFGPGLDSDQAVDVSPLSSVCVALLAEIIDPERGLVREWDTVDTSEDPCDLERLDQHFQSALSRLDERTLTEAVLEWSDSHDLANNLTLDECYGLALALRRIAKQAGPHRHLYLATAECRPVDAPEDPPVSPSDHQPPTDDESAGSRTEPDARPEPTAA